MKRTTTYLALVLSVSVSVCVLAPAFVAPVRSESRPPAVDSGVAGLEQELRKLSTTARVIHTTAHPDDEDGGMLAFESRGMGASVLLMTLNRGEGGQNKTGSELFDALGVLRTLELLAADEYYGVEERFSRVVDFGFSKTPEETFNQWHGHEPPLEDMVRVIRTFRPDVLVSRFQGAPRDGHGHHQAAGILSREAFKAAADPTRFPEQIQQGLLPWQPKKLYMDNVRPNEDYTLKVDTGTYDPALGTSYLQFALDGLAHQLSQGSGGVRVSPGHHYSYYKLIDSVLPPRTSKEEHETSFFDGIDTSLPGLVSRLGTEAAKAPFLDPKLADLVRLISQAEAAFTPDNPARTATPLLAGVGLVSGLISQVESSDLSAAAKLDLLTELRTKREQFQKAANLALGLDLEVNVDAPAKAASQPVDFPAPERTFMMAVPGETFTLTAHLYNRSNRPVMAEDIRLDVPKGWAVELLKKDFKTMKADDSSEAQFKVTVPEDASYTRPYWHRDSTQSDTLYTIDQPEYVNLPFPPYPMKATAVYSLAGAAGEVSSIPKVKYIDPIYGQEERPLAVGPPITLELQPATQVVATAHQGEDDVTVGVRNDVNGPATATLKLELPNGWTAQPPSVQMTFSREGEFASYKFRVKPGRLREDRYKIKAVVDYGGRQYSEGYKVVTREDLDSFYYYHPAVQELSAVSVKTPPALKVGYIMGAGDDIPQVLTQLGIDVAIITPSELASGDLTRYGTIVLGIRAYDVRSDVKDNNQRLLDYVSRGGTLVVQYNQSVQAFNAGTFTPYPMTASTKRVTVEQAPVQILVPDDSIFHFPNEIGSSDFEGWVQERGVYFMEKWDPRFKALMASNDPGEAPLPGGLLRASYGKGTYIYTGYVFFRELPAGVPGAVRLFVNILAAGHEGR